MERSEGGAGERFRGLMETFGMTIETRNRDMRPTYFNKDRASCIDFMASPTGMSQLIQKAGTLCKIGRRLQIIKTKWKADHVPLHISFYSEKQTFSDKKQGLLPPGIEEAIQWDQDAMMRCLREGEKREEVVAEMEKEMKKVRERYENEAWREDHLPDRIIAETDAAIMIAGSKFFKKGSKAMESPELTQARKERMQSLKERGDIKEKRIKHYKKEQDTTSRGTPIVDPP
jgi:hypothetical protein